MIASTGEKEYAYNLVDNLLTFYKKNGTLKLGISQFCLTIFIFLSFGFSFTNFNSELPNAYSLSIPEMIPVPGGAFTMGCQKGRDTNCGSDEEPAHEVRIQNFFLGKYEVTNQEFIPFLNDILAGVGDGPIGIDSLKNLINFSASKIRPLVRGDDGGAPYLSDKYRKARDENWLGFGVPEALNTFPAVGITYDGAMAYCEWLRIRTGQPFRLPTEAEWEYASRGGQRSRNFLYSGSNIAKEVAWYFPYAKGVHEVGQKKPNELGFYDMSGNLLEWCSDWYDENYYNISPRNSPRGPAKGRSHVLRGGSWFSDIMICRNADRDHTLSTNVRIHSIGLRVARD